MDVHALGLPLGSWVCGHSDRETFPEASGYYTGADWDRMLSNTTFQL